MTENEPQQSRLPIVVPIAARAMALLGFGLVSYGAWLAYRPAGFLVAGALLLVVGIGAFR